MRLGELCAGYGGLGMAVEEVFGATTAWFSEYDAAPSKILAHHWPDVPNYGDMTKIDWAAIEHVDIISGGTPCQDLSGAGRRAGMTEGTRSNLWVQMREAIAIQRPKYVVWENVRGAFSAEASSSVEQCPGCVGDTSDGRVFLRALGRVLGDLSDLGYDAEWRGLRAADVGACHGRFRVFVLAVAQDANLAARGKRRISAPGQEESRRPRTYPGGRSGTPLANPSSRGRERDQEPNGKQVTPGSGATRGHFDGRGLDTERLEAWGHYGPMGEAQWGDYAQAIRRWEATLGRRSPAPTEPSARGTGHRLSPRFTEWMMGLPAGWVTDPAIGISRNDQLKACGNGVVPQQATAALRDMLAAFNTKEIAA